MFLQTWKSKYSKWESGTAGCKIYKTKGTYPLQLTDDRGGTGGAEEVPLFNDTMLLLLLKFMRFTLPVNKKVPKIKEIRI